MFQDINHLQESQQLFIITLYLILSEDSCAVQYFFQYVYIIAELIDKQKCDYFEDGEIGKYQQSIKPFRVSWSSLLSSSKEH